MDNQMDSSGHAPTIPTEKLQQVSAVPVRRDTPYAVVLAGDIVGRVIPLPRGRSLILGRTRESDLAFEDQNISREHARFDSDDKGIFFLTDMGSTNGTMVNGKKISRVALCDGDRICVGNVILRFSLKDSFELGFDRKLFDKASKDSLTGVYNKAYFLECLERDLTIAQRNRAPLSLIMLDLDDFKHINDRFGHLSGDKVLMAFANTLMSHIRKQDIIARFGGEEFVLLFKNTPHEKATKIAEKLMDVTREMRIQIDAKRSVSITATMGIASTGNQEFESVEAFIQQADRNLYRGKELGKDRYIG